MWVIPNQGYGTYNEAGDNGMHQHATLTHVSFVVHLLR